jgi:nitroreductase
MTIQCAMDTFAAIEARRSVKHYDPTHMMPEADIRQLMEAAMLSPTSFNMQNWRFVVVDRSDPALRDDLKTASWNQAQVADASLVIVICADLQASFKDPQRYWRFAPKEVQDVLVPMIASAYVGKEQLQRDEGIRSGSIAAQTIMLAAKAMGYDTCPMIGFDPDQVAKHINMPANHIPVLLITVGKALRPANPRSGPLPYDEVVIRNRFS